MVCDNRYLIRYTISGIGENAMEAKKQGAGEEELSMEEILQSIRSIIANDAETTKASEAAQTGNHSASDILELTDMIEDDGSITNLNAQAEITNSSIDDVLGSIDSALAPEKVEPIVEEIKEKIVEPVVDVKVADTVVDDVKVVDTMDSLLSKNAENAALSALSKLKQADVPTSTIHHDSPVFRSGTTVEDMVEEMLRPMMKQWLDDNLPDIVERIVEREVVRLARR